MDLSALSKSPRILVFSNSRSAMESTRSYLHSTALTCSPIPWQQHLYSSYNFNCSFVSSNCYNFCSITKLPGSSGDPWIVSFIIRGLSGSCWWYWWLSAVHQAGSSISRLCCVRFCLVTEFDDFANFEQLFHLLHSFFRLL